MNRAGGIAPKACELATKGLVRVSVARDIMYVQGLYLGHP